MVAPVGELAALGTAMCWAGSALSFEAAGKRIGSLSVNLIRLAIALAFLTCASFILRGLALPTDASPHAWLWLSVSGLVGLTFGDMCLFRAFVVLGARLSVLVMTLVPPLTAIIGWLILGEILTFLDIAGMSATVAGVALVVSERPPPAATGPLETEPPERDIPGSGLMLAFCGALGQASGLVLSKYGMREYNAMAATQIRIIAGLIGLALVFSIIDWWPRVRESWRSPSGLAFTTLGAAFGPVCGVSLSLYAVQHTLTGVASSIMSVTPLLLIPLVTVVHKERVTARSVFGTAVALAGVALLFL